MSTSNLCPNSADGGSEVTEVEYLIPPVFTNELLKLADEYHEELMKGIGIPKGMMTPGRKLKTREAMELYGPKISVLYPRSNGRTLRLLTDGLLNVQFRFPKSKSRRIRKKWSKRLENWRPAGRHYYKDHGVMVCHPSMEKAIREALYKVDSMLLKGMYDSKSRDFIQPTC